MKKLLVILIISLASFTAFAQELAIRSPRTGGVTFISENQFKDGYNQPKDYYKQVKNTFIGIDTSNLIELCEKITPEQFSYYRRSVTDRYVNIVYTNTKGNEQIIFSFSTNEDFVNSNNITAKANLQKIIGSQETLIEIWNTYFLKNATRTQIFKHEGFRVLRNQKDFFNQDATDIHFRVVIKGNRTKIENRNN